MSRHRLVYLFLLVLLVAFTTSMTAPTQQGDNNAARVARWEYKMLRLEGPACFSDTQVTMNLNALGQSGWELMTYHYEHPVPPFPRDADGTLLIVPAATGPNRDVVPQTADSFQGKITMKMEPPQPQQPGVCMMLLKRQWYLPARQ